MSTSRLSGLTSSRLLAPGRPRRRALIAGGIVALLIVAAAALAVVNRSPAIRATAQFVTATPEPGVGVVKLDTELYLPATTPAPAILLAHGFGGSKTDLDSQARSLARSGYVVLAYTARGFGASGGLIHLDSVQYEVADGSRLLDYLQSLPQVRKTDGKLVAGVSGSSYGGALALMLGATDHRIGAVAADITWNNLARSLFPNDVNGSAATAGVFKKLWGGYLFSAGFSGAGSSSSCGKFAAALCSLYQTAAAGGPPSASFATLLEQSSPDSVLSRSVAPTLLTQGEQDSLFPLSEADANAKQLAAAGAPVQVRWRSGGHDAPSSSDDVAGWQKQFFDEHLRGHAATTSDFLISQVGAGISATNGQTVDETLKATAYPGIDGGGAFARTPLTLGGVAQQIAAPAGGSPATVSSIPGLGGLLGADAGLSSITGTAALSRIPGQSAIFSSAPLTVSTLVTGSSQVTLDVTAGSVGNITLFAALHDIAPDGTDTLPARLVAPIQLTGVAGERHTVTVALPWIVARVAAGHRLAVEVATTDFSFALPTTPTTYRVALAQGTGLSLSTLPTSQVRGGGAIGWIVVAVIVVLLCLAYGFWRLRSRRAGAPDEALARVPIVVDSLEKVYGDGYRAVDGVSFRVERGQVLGLLGPNGAGKTTTLRVLMGLILPTAGTIRVFGEKVVPGAEVLSRLGAFVEGPGFLPHLTGDENLRLFWAASGRPVEQADLDTVLEIAGLGSSLFRKVKTYSHGMQQRLAIAQAMLGLPEVLILDEPTNGLDPPQIAEMRAVLGRYAATGRTVIVSSHLLAEVEQTCTHVVVMHRGRLVAAGSVAEVAGTAAMQLQVDDPERATDVLVAAGMNVRSVPARRGLEDVFLDLIGERND